MRTFKHFLRIILFFIIWYVSRMVVLSSMIAHGFIPPPAAVLFISGALIIPSYKLAKFFVKDTPKAKTERRYY